MTNPIIDLAEAMLQQMRTRGRISFDELQEMGFSPSHIAAHEACARKVAWARLNTFFRKKNLATFTVINGGKGGHHE